ncbi:MAG TPA: hypothetical protein VE127_14370 [Solirubrobacteraceae bacterium]|nr:hypothetical protein [Solirubrobacteraceae bacterium]
MSIVLILNIVLAALVIVGIVGMLASSIATPDAPANLVRSARRRRRPTPRPRFVGQTLENRA